MFEEQDKNSGRNNNFYVRNLDAKSNPETTTQKIEMFPGRKTKTQTKHPPRWACGGEKAENSCAAKISDYI